MDVIHFRISVQVKYGTLPMFYPYLPSLKQGHRGFTGKNWLETLTNSHDHFSSKAIKNQ
jgi:hypothetical protein